MKNQKYQLNEKDIQNYINNGDIIILYKFKKKFFEYCEKQKNITIIQIKFNPFQISFGYFYFLDILITSNPIEEKIKFSYDFVFIRKAYEFLIRKREKKLKIIGFKIINDLINYNFSEENKDFCKYKKEIELIKKRIHKTYQKIRKKKKIIKTFKSPVYLENLDIEKVLLKIIGDFFTKKKFGNYEGFQFFINNFDIETLIIDKIIFDKIKDATNLEEFQKKFLLIKGDLTDLDHITIETTQTSFRKINVLYTLIFDVLKNASNMEDFEFLIKTFLLLNNNEVKIKGKKKLLRINDDLKKKFSKIITFFEKNESLLSSYANKNDETKSDSFKKNSKKKSENNDEINENNENTNETTFPKEIIISSSFGIKITKNIFISDFECIEIFESIKNYLGLNNCSKIKLFNLFPKKEKEKLYFEIYDLIKNLENIKEEFIINLEYKSIITDKKIILVIRCEDKVYIFNLEKTETLLRKLRQVKYMMFY